MPAPPAAPARWRHHWPVAVLATLAALLALWARHRLFPAYSWNRDEPVYLWHVEALRAGHLTPTDGGHPELFQPWLSARGTGVLFTQYTLGWPLVLLAAAVVTGSAGSAMALGAALAVAGTYALGTELFRDRRVATTGAALMVASPILPIQGGAYLSYLFTLGLGLLVGALLLSGTRLDRRWRVLAAGVLLGMIFLTRPYDAVLWGAAFGTYVLVRERARWPYAARRLLLTAAGAAPLVAVTLAYNRHVTGGWLAFPITAADPMDSFGFGAKRLMPTFEVVQYGVGTAVRATAKNLFLLPWFLVGGYAGLAAAGVGLWQRRRDASVVALLLVAGAFPLGYFVFWGNHLSSMAARISGPIYFVPLYPPMCLLIATVLVRWWGHRRRLAVGLLAVLVVGTIPGAVTRFDVNHDISAGQAAWRRSVDGVRGRAIVFVADTAPYLLFVNPFSSNGPELDDRILYASDNGPAMLDLMAEQPDRRPYLQQATVAAQDLGPREHPHPFDVRLSRIEVRRGRSLTFTVTASGSDDGDRTRLLIDTGGATTTVPIPAGRPGGSVTVPIKVVPPGATGGLALDDRGTVSLTWHAGSRVERIDLVYRVADGTIEVLLPPVLLRQVLVDGDPVWRRALTLPHIEVDVAAP